MEENKTNIYLVVVFRCIAICSKEEDLNKTLLCVYILHSSKKGA